jgi:hypothetical protein
MMHANEAIGEDILSKREGDIQTLLTEAAAQLQEVENKYRLSLTDKHVSSNLKVKIKNLCENLRSVLDYLACDIRETKCSQPKENERFYFPILQNKEQFKSKMIEWFPGLDSTAPGLYSYLESIQPYHGVETEWLGQFNYVNNENKHSALVEQTKTVTERVGATSSSGGSIQWSPQNVRFGKGISIFGVPVDPYTQLPVPHPSLEVKRIVWVDFRFEGIGKSALGLLKQATDGINQIARKVYELL